MLSKSCLEGQWTEVESRGAGLVSGVGAGVALECF